MARYIHSALSDGEPILFDAKIHWAVFLSPVFDSVKAIIFWPLAYFFLTFIGSDLLKLFFSIEATLKSSYKIPLSLPLIFAFFFIFVPIFTNLIEKIIYYYNSDFVLTDRRVLSKFGFFSRTTSEQRLDKVESIHVYQSFIGRFLNYGTVTVTGTGSSSTRFEYMQNPIACKRAIETQLDALKAP